MFLLKIIFQNSVSTCIKNICPLSILLLVSICIWWNRKFVVQSAGTEKKNWPSEVGKKIFGMPNHSREREPCNVPSPYPPWHITSVMCHGTERVPALCTTNFLFHQILFRGMSGFCFQDAQQKN